MGFDSSTAFVFRVTQFDSAKNLTATDTLGLFCSDVPFINPGQNYCQWQLLSGTSTGFTSKGNYINNSFEGIAVADTELFIHPPRDYYRILQFCPYSYFKSNKKIGDNWSWDFNIGPVWAIKNVYPLQKVETFHNDYRLIDTSSLNTPMGKLLCYHIYASGKSVFGTSYASYYLNNRYGIVRSEIITANGQQFVFDLLTKCEGLAGFNTTKASSHTISIGRNKEARQICPTR
jgi:hypothetical protein